MSKNPAKRRIWYVLGGVALVVLVGVVAGGLWFRSVWHRSLGPSLELPTYTPVEEEAVTVEPSATLPSTSVPTPAPYCRGPETMMILAIGADNRQDNYTRGLADVIRLVRVDFMTPSVSVLAMPRDLWVEIPGIEETSGIVHGKLNEAYTYGYPGLGYYTGPGAGPGLLARTLDANFGWRAEHYIAVNMLTFVDIVDAVGGIDIYLSAPVDGRPIDDRGSNFGYYPAGHHHFDGETALKFSRIRKVDTVFHRMSRQNQVLCALETKLLSPEIVDSIPQLIQAFRGRVITDLSLAQLSQLGCLALQLDRENLMFASLPREWLTGGYNVQGAWVWEVDFDLIRGLIDEFEAGTWPTKSSSGTDVCE
ncbi:MAG: LCP family protein [Anaerolineales bacterium]